MDATDTTRTDAGDSLGAPGCCGVDGPRLDSTRATELAGHLGAIADPVRLQMLSILAASESGEVCACDFVEPIGKSQPTVSHHLKVLAEAGLITGDKRGRWVWYRLAPRRIDALLGTLAEATSAGAADSATNTVGAG